MLKVSFSVGRLVVWCARCARNFRLSLQPAVLWSCLAPVWPVDSDSRYKSTQRDFHVSIMYINYEKISFPQRISLHLLMAGCFSVRHLGRMCLALSAGRQNFLARSINVDVFRAPNSTVHDCRVLPGRVLHLLRHGQKVGLQLCTIIIKIICWTETETENSVNRCFSITETGYFSVLRKAYFIWIRFILSNLPNFSYFHLICKV